MIENELNIFLDGNVSNRAHKSRNIKIINYYYGFRDSQWPTLEETAIEFNVGSRERIRQLIKDEFRKKARIENIPSLGRLSNLISDRKYWSQRDLSELIYNEEISGEFSSIKGLFNLMDDLGIDYGYEIYTPDLSKLTRSALNKFDQNFIIHKSFIKEVKAFYKKVKSIPGRCGIANIKYLENSAGDSDLYNLAKDLIRETSQSWVKEDDDDFWYMLENRDNTIINYSEKVFSLVTECRRV